MTIDERLEALTASLELMRPMTRDLLESSQKQAESIHQQAESLQKQAESNRHTVQIDKIIGGMEKLLHVAEIHETRPTDLEGGA